jgi:hypothetical protein
MMLCCVIESLHVDVHMLYFVIRHRMILVCAKVKDAINTDGDCYTGSMCNGKYHGKGKVTYLGGGGV